MLMKLGILLNGAVGVVLAVPIVRYILSPVIRERTPGYESWLSLGPLAQFPEGETRLATYRNPVANPSDGETANIPCWVRRVDGEKFHFFEPGSCIDRFIERTDVSHLRVSQGSDNCLEIIRPQPNVAIADHEHFVPSVLQTADQIIDLPIWSRDTLLDGYSHTLRPKFPLQFVQQWDGRIVEALNRKDNLKCRILLKTGAAKILSQSLFKTIYRFENGDTGPFTVCAGRGL